MIRKAKVGEVAAIHALVRDFARQNLMLPLSFGDITERIRDFQLYIDDESGQIAGCAALHVVWEGLAEVRSLAVSAEFQKRGIGKALVEALLEDARALGVQDVFTLTFVPDFFERLGFACVDRSTLPHKVWQDCTKCALFPDCGETAMILPLTAGHDCCSCGGGDCG